MSAELAGRMWLQAMPKHTVTHDACSNKEKLTAQPAKRKLSYSDVYSSHGSDSQEESNTDEDHTQIQKQQERGSIRVQLKSSKTNGDDTIQKRKRCDRSKEYRMTMAPEKKSKYNEGCKERQKKYRDRQKLKKRTERASTRSKSMLDELELEMQREYWKNKKRHSRMMMTLEAKKEEREKNETRRRQKRKMGDSCFRSPVAKQRAIERAKKGLPKDSGKWVEVLNAIVADSTTPTKKNKLKDANLVSSPTTVKKRKDCQKIVETMIKTCDELKSKRNNESKATRRMLINILATPFVLADGNSSANVATSENIPVDSGGHESDMEESQNETQFNLRAPDQDPAMEDDDGNMTPFDTSLDVGISSIEADFSESNQDHAMLDEEVVEESDEDAPPQSKKGKDAPPQSMKGTDAPLLGQSRKGEDTPSHLISPAVKTSAIDLLTPAVHRKMHLYDTPSDVDGSADEPNEHQDNIGTPDQDRCRSNIPDFLRTHLPRHTAYYTGQNAGVTKRAITDEKKESIQQFYQREENSVNLPCMKAVNKKTGLPAKYLNATVGSLKRKYVEESGDTISISKFQGLRPANCKLRKSTPWVQCLCEVCENVLYLIEAVNAAAGRKIFTGIYQLCNCTMCEKKDRIYHQRCCIWRQCTECGCDSVKCQLEALFKGREDAVYWKQWKLKTVGTDPCKKKTSVTRMVKVQFTGTISELVSKVVSSLVPFPKHLFYAKWQLQIYREIRDNPPRGVVACTMDFAENLRLESQREVTSAHWGYKQITVSPHHVTYICPDCEDVCDDVVICITDDLNHDSLAVDACRKATYNYLTATRKVEILRVVEASDQCAAQYKSKAPFSDIAKFPLPIEHLYFGSRHGKSRCDGEGGIAKSALKDGIKAQEVMINDSEDAVAFLNKKWHNQPDHESIHKSGHKGKTACLVTVHRDDSKVKKQLITVKGTRNIHSVRSVPNSPDVIAVRNVSCLCTACWTETPGGVCKNEEYADRFTIQKIVGRKKKKVPTATLR